ncbi:MAG: metallophosphoesterase [Leptolyngbyaceae cyanobacterium SL_1_1]|nr:metallophosphoesterase [Leptolyngbyaceae cyanobacterium RM1_1_2]NJO11090.1 metallophosphoesterase [Leptolyngbyaceae cyanobacterium SL_1_1]
MSLSRRNFLVLGGLTLGASTSWITHHVFSRTSLTPTLAAAQAIAPASEALKTGIKAVMPTNPSPAGMFGPQRGDVRLVVFSDINSPYGSTDYRAEVKEAAQMMMDWQPDLVVCAGDLVAGQKLSLTPAEIEAMWQGFDEKVLQPIRATGLPFVFTLGNHDASSVKVNGNFLYATERDLANAYWSDPQRDAGLNFVDRAGYPFYYSTLQNDIFYLVWDASSATVAEDEIAWADRALASDVAQNAKRRIVMGHLPFYAVSQGRDRPGEFLDRADELRALLERHSVHTYICGHHHAYYPARAGNLEFLHCGALGSGPRTWLGRIDAPMQTLAVMDIFWESDTTVYTGYNMGDRSVIALEDLPRQIVGPNGRLMRRDLTLAELTLDEQAQSYVPSLK